MYIRQLESLHDHIFVKKESGLGDIYIEIGCFIGYNQSISDFDVPNINKGWLTYEKTIIYWVCSSYYYSIY
ncbi:hypothetical protein SOV_45230 [Sporomusa ovata DSM 2662]|nr:hypothetical protein SOV_3c07850 [Sporomusa ovata DSM 2662]